MFAAAFFSGLIKRGVDLATLRKATAGIRPLRNRTMMSTPDGGFALRRGGYREALRSLSGPAFSVPKQMIPGSAALPPVQVQNLKTMHRNFGGRIITAGDPYASTRAQMAANGLSLPSLAPAGREAFGRTVLLHENSELGKQPGYLRFSSHRSLLPPLRDLNIASTLTGPGADAAQAIRNMRAPEMEGFHAVAPGFERLNLGNRRISRHAIRAMQAAFDRGTPKFLASLGVPSDMPDPLPYHKIPSRSLWSAQQQG